MSENNSKSWIFDGDFAGQITDSPHTDFYVYEWIIKETGEVFYVGKGRGNRYKSSHGDSMAERIREKYETDIIFVAKNLTEEQAVILESDEIMRILSKTDFVLTNRIIPLDAVRSNFYEKSSHSTKLEFEIAPNMYAEEIEYHYFGVRELSYDEVFHEALTKVALIDNFVTEDLLEIVYDGNYEKYYNETIQMLNAYGATILSSQYAKTLSSWIYCGEVNVTRYKNDKESYYEKHNKYLPTFHLIDVWKFLKNNQNAVLDATNKNEKFESKRTPLSKCKEWDGLDFEEKEQVYRAFDEAEIYRKNSDYEAALNLLDFVRECGYISYYLYLSYAKIYRALKDYDNEIDILEEGIEQYKKIGNIDAITDLISRKRKAEEKRNKLKG